MLNNGMPGIPLLIAKIFRKKRNGCDQKKQHFILGVAVLLVSSSSLICFFSKACVFRFVLHVIQYTTRSFVKIRDLFEFHVVYMFSSQAFKDALACSCMVVCVMAMWCFSDWGNKWECCFEMVHRVAECKGWNPVSLLRCT
jgi:hypothetical protein